MKNQHLSYRSGNPVLTSNAFNLQSDYSDKMTIGGTVNKTFLSLMILIGSAYYSWTYISVTNILVFPSLIGALIVGIITMKKKEILKKLGKKKITVTLKNHKQDLSKLRNSYNFLKKGKKIILFDDSNNHKSYLADFLYDLAKNSIRIESIDVVKSNLEEIFLDLVKS